MDRALHPADELTEREPAAGTGAPRPSPDGPRARPARGRRAGVAALPLALPAAAGMLAFFAAPVVIFFVYSFLTGAVFSFSAEAPFTLSNYEDVLKAPSTGPLLRNSFVIGALVGVVCLAIAVPFAYWLRYHAGRWQLLILMLVVMAMFASYLVRIYAWRTLLGSEGVINGALERLGLIDEPLGFLVFSRFAIVVAMVHILVPFAILIVFAGFRPLEPRYFEAAEDLGAGTLDRWRRVVLPLIAVPAMSAFMLCFVVASADYVTPQFLGGPKSSMVGVQIQNYFKAQGDYPQGAALAVIVLLCYLALQLVLLLAVRLARWHRVEWGT